jgi:RimJ/RimL family protein N-acetyltransferase
VAAEPTLESSEIFCRNAYANFISRKDLSFLMFERSTGRLVGSGGLHRTVWATPKTEVGYWCRSLSTGKGFITEAVTALTRYAFMHIGAVRVELIIDEQNYSSRKVAERCGYDLESIQRNERRAPDGSLRNTCVYSAFPGQ